MQKEVRKHFKLNENENTTQQSFQGTAKAILGWKFIALMTYIRKEGSFQIDKLCFHLKNQKRNKPQNKQNKGNNKMEIQNFREYQ